MANLGNQREDISLWTSFHDGLLESLVHDPLSRSMSVTVDVPYIAEFHKMSSETRFCLILDEVSTLESLQFQPWPGDTVIPDGLSWDEQQAIRRDLNQKGFQQSIDWRAFIASLTETSEYDVSHAAIAASNGEAFTLILGLSDFKGNDHPQARITAKRIHFFVGDRELEMKDFLSLGEAYWHAFYDRSLTNQNAN